MEVKKMDKCGIYKITNLINNKLYIGQSRFIMRRFQKHKSEAINNNPLPLYNAIRKYGIENFAFDVLEECEPKQLNDREAYYMFLYNSFVPFGYNIRVPSDEGYYVHVPDYIYEIYDLLRTTNLSYEEIGKQFDLSASHIYNINYGNSWKIQDIIYPIRKKYLNWDTSQVIVLLQQGLKTKEIAEQLHTTKGTIESFMYANNIHTPDFRKLLTSNPKIARTLSNEKITYNSIKEAGEELSKQINIDANTALCGIKRALKGSHAYKNYNWYYEDGEVIIDNRQDDE